ncbi:5'-methylthioadenosine/S-adenosylhomocysteine nucleosidase [subsurface metagenome]
MVRHSKVLMVICISAILLCSSCSPVLLEENSRPVTAVLGAFEREIIMLEDELTDKQEQRIEGMKFASGRLNGKRIVVAWTGIGKVNAAMTTTLLIEHFRPNEVIFTGVAGGINPQLSPGDIVIAEKTAQHDSGTLWPDSFEHRGARNPLDGWRNPVFFPADERLLKLAVQAAEQVELETIKTSIGERTPRIVKGVVVTGDVFVASPEKCTELRNELGADAVEMEGAAVAQICYQQGIPCLVIRSISDKADEKAREDLGMFHTMAAKNSARLVTEMVELLASELSVEKSQKPQ